MPRNFNMSIRNLAYRLRAFEEAIPLYLEDVVKSQEDVIVRTIANNQLYRRGINGMGVKIREYRPYATSTIKIKKAKGQPTSRVTLRDTGEFHGSMYLVCDTDGFYVTSGDDKTPYLVRKYGESIFRLTNQNLTQILNRYIRTELSRRIRQAISGT